MNDLEEVEAMDGTPEQAAQPSQLMTILFGLNPVPHAAETPAKQAEVAAAIPAAPGKTDDTEQVEDKVRDLLRLVGVDQAINLIREEAGQGASSHFYDVARDPDLYDLLVEEELPYTAHEIVRLIGLPRAIDLFRTLGGVDFPAPTGTGKNRLGTIRFEMMAECVGVDAAKALCKEFGGTRFYIPKCQQALQNIRDRRIIREFDKGASTEELALKFRLTDRRVQDILKKSL